MPENTAIRYHQAQALVSAGREEDARGVLKQMLVEHPYFPEREDAQALLVEIEGR